MTDTTQPPAETLAERLRAAVTYQYMPMAVRKLLSEAAAALTRRAGGDAIPAGVSAVMGRIVMHYGEDPSTLARIKGMVAQYREAPFRSADWLAGEIMRILDSEPANDITPKPPAGGDAGAVERLARIRTSMALLQQNSEGCALNHYGDDAEAHGLPGWLADTRADLDAFADILAALALPAPVVEGDSPYVAGPIWAEEEDDCFTAEIQISGGHYVVATVHGATRDQVEQRQRAILAALSEGRSHG